mmetsp:Transcript_39886/g.120050  ORF Transcript_39886/g.120050 Transcript_39886/m.120050 type:complete len:167 (-) Transcript_39886:240-740(-)
MPAFLPRHRRLLHPPPFIFEARACRPIESHSGKNKIIGKEWVLIQYPFGMHKIRSAGGACVISLLLLSRPGSYSLLSFRIASGMGSSIKPARDPFDVNARRTNDSPAPLEQLWPNCFCNLSWRWAPPWAHAETCTLIRIFLKLQTLSISGIFHGGGHLNGCGMSSS